MRHTFGTHLSKAGVTLRTAQAALRHSTPTLTANVYTDPKLLDVAGAIDALPALPLDATPPQSNVAQATGTDAALPIPETNTTARTLVLPLVLAGGNSCNSESIPDSFPNVTASTIDGAASLTNPNTGNKKTPADISCQPGASLAGDGTRTRNSQLGRLALYH